MDPCNYERNIFEISGSIAAIMGSFYNDRNDIYFGVMGKGRALVLEFQSYYLEIRGITSAISIPSMGMVLYISDIENEPWIGIWAKRI